MGGAADPSQRSSSPLKRRASSMDLEQSGSDRKDDVDMISAPDVQPETAMDSSQATVQGDISPPIDSHDAKAELPLRNDIPPLDQQVKTIETLVKAFAETPVQEGDVAYLVSRQWLSRAEAFGTDGKRASKASTPPSLGPVDNSDIIQGVFTDSSDVQFVQLKPGLGHADYELFPKEAWDLLMTWYRLKPGQPPVMRTAHNTAPDAISAPNVQFELYPPVFTIHRLWSATSPIPIEQELKLKKPPPVILARSTSCPYHRFLQEVKQRTGVQEDRKVRIWRVLQTLPADEATGSTAQPATSGMNTPPDSPRQSPEGSPGSPRAPGAWPELLVDVETFLRLERDVGRARVDADDTTTNPKYNGKKSLSLVGLTVNEILVIDESIDKDNYVSNYKGTGLKDQALTSKGSSGSLVAIKGANASGRSSPALGPLTRGRTQQKSGRTIGCCGLQNLGNTCYLNSALQCLRAVEELTKYFLTHEAKKEINPDNPLACNGDVAMAYGRLLEEIYKDPPPNSVAPRHFKSIVGRYAPAFSGYGQQDSQEFLGFLLDALQEDLNRIKRKPYIEKPDSTDDMINNPAAIREMAEKVWDITKKRDDSVIADLFTGMYKSTLVCPECDKVSITFDPFNNLTLPLPVASVWTKDIKFLPLNDNPVTISVDIDKNSSIKKLKEFVSARVGVPAERLVVAEEFRDKFFKFYDELSSVSEEIQANDIPVIYEVEAPPTNHPRPAPQKDKKKSYRSLLNDEPEPAASWNDPMAERLLVPVLHRMDPTDPNTKSRSRKQGGGELPPPHFIVLTPEEAYDDLAIRRKILEKVATYTTWSKLADDESDTAETTDPEMLNNTSDVDSGDLKVVAKSVEGEEDIVDVIMTEAPNGKKATPASNGTNNYPKLLKKFNHRKPKWMNPREFLDGELQGLFEMNYWAEPDVLMPTGWQSIQDSTPLPRLCTRQPKPSPPPPSDAEMRSPTQWPASDESGSEENSSAQVSSETSSAQTRMTEESSEEDPELPKLKNLNTRQSGTRGQAGVRGKGKKMKAGRVYGKKGKKRFEKQQQQRAAQAQRSAGSEAELLNINNSGADDNGPLVRLGEGIVVDWREEAFDKVFDGASQHDTKGVKTWSHIQTLDDPQLEIDRKRRQMRRKNGITLDDCLSEFEKEEILSEQDTWYCPRCKEHQRASKKFDLWKTPDILAVHLKRFSNSGWRREKLDVLVDFPVEDLDLTQRVIGRETGKEEVFDLIAVDNHYGGLGGGHYTAFAKNFVDGEWYEFNDASVTKQKDPSKVISPAAYLLFYRRRSENPLGGPRFQEIFNRYNAQHSDDDLDSGEGQRLGQGSSLCGSPSALTGADLTRLRGNGLASGRAASPDDTLPSYQQATLDQDGDGDDPWNQQQGLRNSIEAQDVDEGIELQYSELGNGGGLRDISSALETNWSWANLDAEKTRDDDASDVAQGDGSSDGGFASDVDVEGPMPRSEYFAAQNNDDHDYSAFTTGEVHEVPATDLGDEQVDHVTEIHVVDDNEHAHA